MSGQTHPGVDAICREINSTRERMALTEGDDLDVDAAICLLHDYGSTASLIADLPLPADDQGLRSIGATGAVLMQLSETLASLLDRERARAADTAAQLAARQRSNRNVLASLLGLSVLLNAMLAFVALR
jgi:hypothetical protein